MYRSPFEPYLDILEQSLCLLPQAERAEWREETRQHLQEIARNAEEGGLAPEEAMAAAMRQFGDAAEIGEWMAQSTGSDLLTSRKAAALFSRPLIVAMVLLIFLAYAYVLTDSPILLTSLQIGGSVAFVSVPLVGGWHIGKCLRSGQSHLSIALGLMLAGLLSLPIAGVLLVPALGTPIEGAALDFRWGILWIPLTALSLLLARRGNTRCSETAISRA